MSHRQKALAYIYRDDLALCHGSYLGAGGSGREWIDFAFRVLLYPEPSREHSNWAPEQTRKMDGRQGRTLDDVAKMR